MTPMTQTHPFSEASDLQSARRVLTLEAEALQSLAQGLDGAFVKALDILGAVEGRVVVSGMGKSGHIARKIAASLASTGTPAVFVHPAEASHGDLGMITQKDAVLALSNSGETVELTDLIAYTRRFAIPLVGITSRAGSTLCDAADVALVLPLKTEACPMGLAPTTSTTMMLGLGDALAVTLLERRGFTAADFQMLHPGGALGRRLLKVSDLMHAGDEVPLVGPELSMAETLLVMTNKRFGCAGVVGADGKITGIVTDGDLRRHMSDGMLSRKAGEVMTADPKTVRPQTLAAEALRIMNASAITTLFVVDGGKPVGILHIHDCLRAGVA
ncbi:MAG: KpsF/GutQ family sugar-phosphate isomerase [Rhodospirillales bacterium]|nr:MAG: KpsF/GutQ family sugar-phosphate isomerase [Rhodospirillales bacterium]